MLSLWSNAGGGRATAHLALLPLLSALAPFQEALQQLVLRVRSACREKSDPFRKPQQGLYLCYGISNE